MKRVMEARHACKGICGLCKVGPIPFTFLVLGVITSAILSTSTEHYLLIPRAASCYIGEGTCGNLL